MNKDKRPHRLSIELTPEQTERLNKLVPWGSKQPLMSALIDDIITMIEVADDKSILINAFISRRIHLWNFGLMFEVEEEQ